MTQSKNQEILYIYLNANDLYGNTMSKFFPTDRFRWIDYREPHSNKYSSNNSKGFVLKVDLEYPEDLPESYNDYLLAPDKTEIKWQMLPKYQLMIADF